jgi:dTDP-4-amino-4,6-dideoxygalactose transaminase
MLTALGLGQAMQRLFQPLPGATANVVLACSVIPVFADVKWGTYNTDPTEVSDKLTPRTKAVMAVDLFGLCANMEDLRKYASGSSSHGISLGGLGDTAACFLSWGVLLRTSKMG